MREPTVNDPLCHIRDIGIRVSLTLVSNEYHGMRYAYEWECVCGNVFLKNCKTVSQRVKPGCVKCNPPRLSGGRRISIEDVRELGHISGYYLLSCSYAHYNDKLVWRCPSNHVVEISYSNFSLGHRCNECSLAGRRGCRSTLKEISGYGQAVSLTLLSRKVANEKQVLRWKCSDGHIVMASPIAVKNLKFGCLVCYNSKERRKVSMRFRSVDYAIGKGAKFGYDLLSEQYNGVNAKYSWRCREGHVFEAALSNIIAGHGCGKCNKGIGEALTRKVFEHVFKREFPSVRPDWLRNPRTGYPLEIDGYCQDIGIAFEYQGLQHSTVDGRMTRTAEDLFKRKALDKFKRLKCAKHGVKLVCIHQVKNQSFEKMASGILRVLRGMGIEIDGDESATSVVHRLDVENTKLKSFKGYLSRNNLNLASTYSNYNARVGISCDLGHAFLIIPAYLVKENLGCVVCQRSVVDADKVARVAKLLETGKTRKQVAVECGMSLCWVHKYARKAISASPLQA
jgi:hypothetical protein